MDLTKYLVFLLLSLVCELIRAKQGSLVLVLVQCLNSSHVISEDFLSELQLINCEVVRLIFLDPVDELGLVVSELSSHKG